MTLISIEVSALIGMTFENVATDPQKMTEIQIKTLSSRKSKSRWGTMEANIPQTETVMETEVKTMPVTRSVPDLTRSRMEKRRTTELTKRIAHHLKRSRAMLLDGNGCWCYLFILMLLRLECRNACEF
jgi:hypothetical protein